MGRADSTFIKYREAYQAQKYNARKRGIGFYITSRQNVAEISPETRRKARMKRALTPRKPRATISTSNKRAVLSPEGKRYE